MALKGNQKKLDRNNNNRIDAQDFKILKAEKAKGRGMGLQDEKVQPGKVMKAKRGSGLDLPVINRVKINKKSLHKNLMKGKNPYSDLVKTTEKGPKSFIERRKELGGRALRAAKATRIGKIAAGVAGVGLAAKAYLNKKLEESKAKRKAKGKMGGGLAAATQRLKAQGKMGGGMMKKPMGYDIGGGVSKAKEHKKIIKDKAGSLLGYVGEMAKTISKVTPVGAAQEAGKKVVELVKSKKEQKRKKRFNDRIQMPLPLPNKRPKYERMPLPLPNKRPKYERMPLPLPNKKPKYTPLMGGGMMRPMGYSKGKSVMAKGCKLGRKKPTKMY